MEDQRGRAPACLESSARREACVSSTRSSAKESEQRRLSALPRKQRVPSGMAIDTSSFLYGPVPQLEEGQA